MTMTLFLMHTAAVQHIHWEPVAAVVLFAAVVMVVGRFLSRFDSR